MIKCVDCYYFDNPFSHGRKELSCSDMGELPTNEACPRFKKLVVEDKASMLKGEGPHFEFSYQSVFMDIMTEVFEIQKAADLVVNNVTSQLSQQGYAIEFDSKFFLSAVQKATEIIVMQRVLLGLGLGTQKDEVVSWIISDKFARRDVSSPQVTNQHAGRQANDLLGDIQNSIRELIGKQGSITDSQSAIQSAIESLGKRKR